MTNEEVSRLYNLISDAVDTLAADGRLRLFQDGTLSNNIDVSTYLVGEQAVIRLDINNR